MNRHTATVTIHRANLGNIVLLERGRPCDALQIAGTACRKGLRAGWKVRQESDDNTVTYRFVADDGRYFKLVVAFYR